MKKQIYECDICGKPFDTLRGNKKLKIKKPASTKWRQPTTEEYHFCQEHNVVKAEKVYNVWDYFLVKPADAHKKTEIIGLQRTWEEGRVQSEKVKHIEEIMLEDLDPDIHGNTAIIESICEKMQERLYQLK